MNITIDIFCLFNSENIFQNKISYDKFQGDRYEDILLNIELESISAIIALTHLLDLDNKEIVDLIFKVIFIKLYKFQNFKKGVPVKLFSPHLITIKCYSLFLNRYCFNYSIKNKCDLFDAFNHFLEVYPQAKEINIFVFNELISFFGFIIANKYSFFSCFGKNMFLYYINYFNSILNFIKCDITLFKYLLIQPEIKEQFNIENITLLSNVDLVNGFFFELIRDNVIIDKVEFKTDYQRNCVKFSNSILECLYLFLRDNLSMEKLAFRYTNFKFKMKDEIYDKLYLNEKDKINKLVRNEIIHFILGKKNLVKRDECIDYLEVSFDSNYVEILDDILKNDCEKKVLTNGLTVYSIKKEKLNVCDIDNIITLKHRDNAIEYMTNFQSKNFNLSNTNILEPLNIQKRLMKNAYEALYSEKNIDIFIKLYNLIYNHQEKKELCEIFRFNLTKILTFAFKLCSTDILDEDFKNKLLLKLNKIEDKALFKEKISDDKSKSNLKEKLKKKFEQKNEVLNEKLASSNINIEEEIQKEHEGCVYCRQPIYIDTDMNKIHCFGKLHYYFSDYITDVLKKKPEGQRKKAKKFVGCNHKMHFKCFNEFIVPNLTDKKNKEFECPLCKKLSNIILCDFSLIEKKNYDIIKGINFTNDKINIDVFYEKDKGDILNELYFANISMFENYCSELFHKQILIKDFDEDKNLLEQWFKLITEDFEEFNMHYSRTNNKQEQIEIWRNILYNIRLLFKYKKVKITDNIIQLMDNIVKINNFEIFEKILINYDFCDIINMFIIISFILFDSNEENINNIKNIFNKNILLYYIYITYIKSNKNDNLDLFISNNINEIKKTLDLYSLKYKICLLLFNEKEENINLDISKENLLSIIKENADLIKIIKSNKKDTYFSRIKDQYLSIPEFKIIDLPESGIEFLKRINGDCLYCHKKNLSVYLCLFCGNKMCNSVDCLVENSLKKRNEYSAIYHSKICCGGNGLFLDVSNSEIIYISKRRIIDSNIFVYLNDFGDVWEDKNITDEYKLNKIDLNRGIMKFIDMTFRRKKNKIYYLGKI